MSKWGDRGVTNGFEGENVDRFRVEEGKKDLIRIISDPIRYYSHSLKVPPYYITCRKEEGECPACNAGISRKQRIGCLIVHIGRKDAIGGGDFQRVGQVKPWLFAKDRWFDIVDIIDNNPQLRAEGALKKTDLIVTCKEEQFQDMRISPTLQPSKMKKDMLTNLQEAKDKLDFYTSGMPVDKQLEALGGEGQNGDMESLSEIADEAPADDVPFDVPEESTDDATENEIDDIMADLEGSDG